MINDVRGIVYAPEYPNQIRDLVWNAENWISTIPARISIVDYLKSLDFSQCKCDAMISLSLRTVYCIGSQTSVWNSTVERARKELLSRGIDADRKLVGLVRKSKTSN